MSRNPIDHGHTPATSHRTMRFLLIERMRAGDGGHRKIQILDRRRKGRADPTRLRRYLQIERGHLA